MRCRGRQISLLRFEMYFNIAYDGFLFATMHRDISNEKLISEVGIIVVKVDYDPLSPGVCKASNRGQPCALARSCDSINGKTSWDLCHSPISQRPRQKAERAGDSRFL